MQDASLFIMLPNFRKTGFYLTPKLITIPYVSQKPLSPNSTSELKQNYNKSEWLLPVLTELTTNTYEESHMLSSLNFLTAIILPEWCFAQTKQKVNSSQILISYYWYILLLLKISVTNPNLLTDFGSSVKSTN